MHVKGLSVDGLTGLSAVAQAARVLGLSDELVKHALAYFTIRDEALREALELAQRLDAERLARDAREELRVAGARPRRDVLTGPASLTASERRVADAAAAGATNREIAAQLFLSPKTVEMHLGRVYRKLDIGSRGELAGALGGPAVVVA